MDIPSLTVTGTANEKVSPDVATVRIGAIAQGKTAKAAQDSVNTRVAEFIRKAKAMLGDKGEVETGNINLQPLFRQEPNQPRQEIIGYQASNTLNIQVFDFTLVGPVIDTAVESGLNNVEYVSFGLRDDSAARVQALRNAVKQAEQKARAMAEAANVDLVGILDLQEGGARVMPVFRGGMEMAAARAADTPVEPGSVTVSGEVTIRYQIRARR